MARRIRSRPSRACPSAMASHLDMRQLGKHLGGRIVEGVSQAKHAVAGVAELEQLREMTDDALASVASRADDEDCRSHSEFLDAMREQVLKVKGCCNGDECSEV